MQSSGASFQFCNSFRTLQDGTQIYNIQEVRLTLSHLKGSGKKQRKNVKNL